MGRREHGIGGWWLKLLETEPMLSRRSFLQLATTAIVYPSAALGSEYETIGQMDARYIGEVDGAHRWGYRSSHVDSAADLDPAAAEYVIEIVLPDSYPTGGPYPVLYVGQASLTDARGNGLLVAKQAGIHNEYGCILVSNTWKSMPWYGTKDDGSRRYDTHIRWNVLALLDQKYDTLAGRENRLFIGYSKSGWGALSMLLRGPTYFGYAAAWDAPWEMTFGSWGSGDAFGTEARFAAYDPKQIVAENVAAVDDRERIWISAGTTFLDHHAPMVARLAGLGVPHRARFLPAAEHHWDAAWVTPACRALFDMRAA